MVSRHARVPPHSTAIWRHHKNLSTADFISLPTGAGQGSAHKKWRHCRAATKIFTASMEICMQNNILFHSFKLLDSCNRCNAPLLPAQGAQDRRQEARAEEEAGNLSQEARADHVAPAHRLHATPICAVYATARATWVAATVADINLLGADGINFGALQRSHPHSRFTNNPPVITSDIEGAEGLPNRTGPALTHLLTEMRQAGEVQNPHFQISFCSPIYMAQPICEHANEWHRMIKPQGPVDFYVCATQD